MPHQRPLKLLQASVLSVIAMVFFVSLAAADPRPERKAPATQPISQQPQQPASPVKPAVEPLDDDSGTFLV